MTHVNHNSLDKLSNSLGYVQTAIARTSGFLLMLGLVVAMTNLLLKDALFTLAPWLEWVWAASQSLAVDANLWLVAVLLAAALTSRDWVRAGIYALICGMLLFVACVITDVESLRQALNITLSAAFGQVLIPIQLLTLVRSVVVVLLVAMSGLDMVVLSHPTTPKKPVSLPSTVVEGSGGVKDTPGTNGKSKSGYDDWVIYKQLNPSATRKQASVDLKVSMSTINNYVSRSKK